MWNGCDWAAVFSDFVVLAFLLLFIVFIIWWARSMFRRGNARPEAKTPLDVAKERYARGEISREQFDQIKKDIS